MGFRSTSYYGWQSGTFGTGSYYDIQVDPNGVMYAVGYPIQKSVDGGQSWKKLSQNARALAFDDSGNLYTTSGNVFAKSVDKGNNWTSITFNSSNPGDTLEFASLDICLTGSKIYIAYAHSAGTRASGSIYESLDQGVTWKKVYNGISGDGDVGIAHAGVQSIKADSSGNLYATFRKSRQVGTSGDFYVLSSSVVTETGSEWSVVYDGTDEEEFGYDIDVDSNDIVYVAYGDSDVPKLLSSSDYGVNWGENDIIDDADHKYIVTGVGSGRSPGTVFVSVVSASYSSLYLYNMDFTTSLKYEGQAKIKKTYDYGETWTDDLITRDSFVAKLNSFELNKNDDKSIYFIGRRNNEVDQTHWQYGALSANSASLGRNMLSPSIAYVLNESLGAGEIQEGFKINNVAEFPHSNGIFQMPNLVLGTKDSGHYGKNEDAIVQVKFYGSLVYVAWPKQDEKNEQIKGFGDSSKGSSPGKLSTDWSPGEWIDVTEHDHLTLWSYVRKELSGTLDALLIRVERKPLKGLGPTVDQVVSLEDSGSFYVEANHKDSLIKKDIDYGDLSMTDIGFPSDIPLINTKELRISVRQKNGQTADENKNLIVWRKIDKIKR